MDGRYERGASRRTLRPDRARRVSRRTELRTRVVPILILTAFFLQACSASDASDAGAAASGEPAVRSISARAHLVTGGDVLLRVEADGGNPSAQTTITLNGEDVRDRFRPARNGRGLVGLVAGLRAGENQIRASIGGADASLTLTNHPVSGPIISGPHEAPFLCQTQEFAFAAGETTLGAPVDDTCSVPTRIDYVYLSATDGEFHPYSAGDSGSDTDGVGPATEAIEPTEIASATTLDGTEVPFVVRVETGTINRAIYEIAMLHHPGQPAPDPWTRSDGWNGKLVYTHGGGCRAGWFQQGDRTGGVLREGLLEMGYAIASSSLNVFGQNCNDLLASETHIMVKERFIEGYGEPIYTIATGGSGGSYQSHQTADNYPGVFDGLIVSSSFPDVTSATIFTLADARLLHHYFTEVAPGKFTRDQERLISGFGSWGSLPNLSRGAARLDPTFEPEDPPEEQGGEVSLEALEGRRFSSSNTEGIRATVYDHTVNVYGRREATGSAARPLDNHGVQYGLDVLDRGEITAAQFIALNRDIGGFDENLEHVPDRHRADPQAARRARDTGRILYGGAGLASTPVIDYRSYTDHREGGDIHMIVHQFSTRARLMAANGHADNHVMSVGGRWGFTDEEPDLGELFRQMDRWLMNVRSDESGAELSEKVVLARPDDLVDHCWDGRGAVREKVVEPLAFDGTGRCAELYPGYPTPRQVAGAPLANDIVSCYLAPPDPSDYDVEFTDEEWRELERVFPDGVCDWAAGDRHSEGYQGTWLSFGPSEVDRAF